MAGEENTIVEATTNYEVVEYRKHLQSGEAIDPEWIVFGGYFYDRDSDTYMGIIKASDSRDYYIPDTVTVLTIEEAIQRVLDINSVYPWVNTKSVDEDGNKQVEYKTNEEIDAWVRRVIEEKPNSAEMY